jgi:RHS repeat-associated protein
MIGNTANNLAYRYNGNRLMAAQDNGGTNTLTGDFRDNGLPLSSDDFTYDAHGNIVSDNNPRYGGQTITNIVYNRFNKPTTVTFSGTNKNYQYTYDGTGNMLRRVVNDGPNTTTTDYVSGVQYENGSIDFFNHPEGYVKRNADNSFAYKYLLKDHLSNTRTVLSAEGNIEQKTDYYPFGLEIYRVPVGNEFQYKYNGKEKQNLLGFGWYNYGFRFYDPGIARFPQLDPLAHDYVYLTPYQYASNDPIKNIDLDGLEGFPVIGLEPIALFSRPPIISRVAQSSVENAAKTSAELGGERVIRPNPGVEESSPHPLGEHITRGRDFEGQVIDKLGLEKNNKPFEAVDPVSGKNTRTIPDASQPGKSAEQYPVEIKNTGSNKTQYFTRQIRAQEQLAKDNGGQSTLIVPKGTKLSAPLKDSGVKIEYFTPAPTVIDKTKVNTSPQTQPIPQKTKQEIKCLECL